MRQVLIRSNSPFTRNSRLLWTRASAKNSNLDDPLNTFFWMHKLGTRKKLLTGCHCTDNPGHHSRTYTGRRGSLGEGFFHIKKYINKEKIGLGIITGTAEKWTGREAKYMRRHPDVMLFGDPGMDILRLKGKVFLSALNPTGRRKVPLTFFPLNNETSRGAYYSGQNLCGNVWLPKGTRVDYRMIVA